MQKSWILLYLGGILVASAVHAQPALTIYNQDFAVVRETVPLQLKQGVNQVSVSNVTAHVEPDSVILRDPTGQRALQILEQNYRADSVSQELLLSLYEGKTIDFEVQDGPRTRLVRGKIIRSGYVPHESALRRYDQAYYQTQMAFAGGANGQPVIEVGGKLRFGLPGTPLFPGLPDDTILRPTLHWLIGADRVGPLQAELAYVTGGLTWYADYNVVSPEQGDALDLGGWVTMDNQSGKTFQNARIKLMAGDVNKLQSQQSRASGGFGFGGMGGMTGGMTPPVAEKSFDEYHLYSLARPTTLRDRETKQVEFVRADKIKAQRLYVYDGAKIDWSRFNDDEDNSRQARTYGTLSNPKVWVMSEIKNSSANGLGIPLPKGRVRFYRRDSDGRMEFIGENAIDHTPKDETLRVYMGSAFDITGERRQTAYTEQRGESIDESFEIKLRNHKSQPVAVRVVEHLYRWSNWEIATKSDPFEKTNSRTIEFHVQVPPNTEKILTYRVHYTVAPTEGQ